MLIVLVHNVSAGAPVSDYVWEVRVNNKRIAAGNVAGHRRDDGWRALLKRIAGDVDMTRGEAVHAVKEIGAPWAAFRNVRALQDLGGAYVELFRQLDAGIGKLVEDAKEVLREPR